MLKQRADEGAAKSALQNGINKDLLAGVDADRTSQSYNRILYKEIVSCVPKAQYLAPHKRTVGCHQLLRVVAESTGE
jgi:hypothetical protein